ncbi:collagenase [Cytobacillus sp. IB215665]|uniref:collagenase n=1 Tax=Cytobacillus sp. IB215665 TaxID=3097357 RepID=UPI002A0D11F6|nr:collagenase [Cytobacillus sp. IB215665]MDX8366275.1 collagenase [Cytobacillus sp. IB215665]
MGIKKKLMCNLCSVFLATSILSPVGGSSYAQGSNAIKREEGNININEIVRSSIPQLDSNNKDYEETIHVERGEKLTLYPTAPPRNERASTIKSAAVENVYTFKDLLTYSNESLVGLLVTMTTENISDFWNYSVDAVEFYSDRTRLLALRDAIVERGSLYTANDDVGLPTLIEVLNRGFYIGFDNPTPELSHLQDLTFRYEMNEAISSVVTNRHFELGTTTQEEILTQIGFLMNHGTPDINIFNAVLPVIEEFNVRVNTYINDLSKTDAIYALLNGFEYNLYFNYYSGSYTSVQEAPWYGRVDSFLNEVAKILEFSQFVGTDSEWLIDNGIWVIGEEGRFHSNPDFTLNVFTDAIATFPYYSGLYLAVAKKIDDLGGPINYEQIKTAYEDYYYGQHYIFDNGEIIIKAGNQVTTEEIQRIYWAAKEEKAQFHRYFGVDSPVEEGNPDDTLTTIIYNNKEEYKLNRFINGVGTDNGGIYIESWGTFFTWDREVPTDSIYELEELFRHEYFHYLQSRYVVPGLWGNTPLYDGDRLAWFEEGGGEFFAGATRTGVEPRATKVEGISANPADRYTLDTVLHASYSLGWDFYDYSYAFYDFIINKHIDIFYRINELVANEDEVGFDRYMDQLSRDANLENEYQNHLAYLYDNKNQWGVPLVSDVYVSNHPEKSLAEINSDITAEINLNNVTQNIYTADFFNTYTLSGEYVGGTSYGEMEDFQNMNDIVNQVIIDLSRTGQWSGYETLTAYFVNHRVNASGQYEYDVVFHGKYTGNSTNSNPIAIISGNSQLIVGETVQFYSTDSYDSDGSIVSFQWDFGDGNTSARENPTHLYTEAGIFTVQLIVRDNEGATDSISMTVNVNNASGALIESEPNDRQTEANMLTYGDLLSGSLDYATSSDHTDWYFFDVDGAGALTIDVSILDGTDFNVLVEDESGNRIAEPLTDASFHATTGRYYIVVYTWAGEWVDYTLALNAEQTEPGNGGVATESEPNDRQSEANLIESVMTGALDYGSNDHTDWYYFDVNTEGVVTIHETKISGTDYNILVEDENGNRVAEPIVNPTFNVSPGRYYVIVYTWEGNAVDYELELVK